MSLLTPASSGAAAGGGAAAGKERLPQPPASSCSELSSEVSASEMSSEVGSTASSDEPPPHHPPASLPLLTEHGAAPPPPPGGPQHHHHHAPQAGHLALAPHGLTLPPPPHHPGGGGSGCYEDSESWLEQRSEAAPRPGRGRVFVGGDDGPPHSRYLRRAHSSDRAPCAAPGRSRAELERCHSEENLRAAFPATSAPQGFTEHARLPSPPIKQPAR